MSDDKRRKARIQGAWAARPTKPQQSAVAEVETSSRQPAWHSDSTSVQVRPTFLPDEQCSPVASTKVIDQPGTFDISTEPSGVSRLRLIPGFVDAAECDRICEQLQSELPWQQETVVDRSRESTYVQPRLTAWIGDLPYSYSGITHEPNHKWPPVVWMLKERINLNTGLSFNSVLANLYRDGHDHVAWHCDDEPSLGDRPTIASLSFGDTRNFELRKKPPPEMREKEDFVYTEYIKVPLDAGSLLIMEGTVQNDWQHRVPREYHDRGPRVNLTFRIIYPEP